MINKTVHSVTHNGDSISIRFTDDTVATIRRQNPAIHNDMGSSLTITLEHPSPFLNAGYAKHDAMVGGRFVEIPDAMGGGRFAVYHP